MQRATPPPPVPTSSEEETGGERSERTRLKKAWIKPTILEIGDGVTLVESGVRHQTFPIENAGYMPPPT